MNVLVIGSGGREHALAWKISKSPRVKRVYAAPGNPGMASVATCFPLAVEDKTKVVGWCRENSVDLVVVGPEAPLAMGLIDALQEAKIMCFGPTRKASSLECSKAFTKKLCKRVRIPTPAAESFTKEQVREAKAFIESLPGPRVVVKADGLAAGKGVVIAESKADACMAMDEMLGGKFGSAGATVVIEEFVVGEEVSFYAISDGKTAMYFGSAQDHKRLKDGDRGPNTGGMGAYLPPPILTEELKDKVMTQIIHPTVQEMQRMGEPFKGVLFAGLMIRATDGQPMLLEYNVRFGDPETQPLMVAMTSDLVPLLTAAASGTLAEQSPPQFRSGATLCVVVAAKGYPGSYNKGTVIEGIAEAEKTGAVVFHAGTSLQNGKVVATGGRVLGVTASGSSVAEAQRRAYIAVDRLRWPEGFCRRDIGFRAVAVERRKAATAAAWWTLSALAVAAVVGAVVVRLSLRK
eukprot:RCo024133